MIFPWQIPLKRRFSLVSIVQACAMRLNCGATVSWLISDSMFNAFECACLCQSPYWNMIFYHILWISWISVITVNIMEYEDRLRTFFALWLCRVVVFPKTRGRTYIGSIPGVIIQVHLERLLGILVSLVGSLGMRIVARPSKLLE